MINYDTYLQDKETPSYMKDLIKDIQTTGSTTVGGWIKKLSTFDLCHISMASEYSLASFASKNPDEFLRTESMVDIRNQFILTDILADAEGLDPTRHPIKVLKRMALLDQYLRLELLKRRGINLELFYRNMSLNEDMSSPDSTNPIVQFNEDCDFKIQSPVTRKNITLPSVAHEFLKAIDSQDLTDKEADAKVDFEDRKDRLSKEPIGEGIDGWEQELRVTTFVKTPEGMKEVPVDQLPPDAKKKLDEMVKGLEKKHGAKAVFPKPGEQFGDEIPTDFIVPMGKETISYNPDPSSETKSSPKERGGISGFFLRIAKSVVNFLENYRKVDVKDKLES